MFGSLFDDERPAGVMTSVHTLAVPRPPNRRLLCGLSGIENQGATCYLNSLLQTLLYTPEFRGIYKFAILLRDLTCMGLCDYEIFFFLSDPTIFVILVYR